MRSAAATVPLVGGLVRRTSTKAITIVLDDRALQAVLIALTKEITGDSGDWQYGRPDAGALRRTYVELYRAAEAAGVLPKTPASLAY